MKPRKETLLVASVVAAVAASGCGGYETADVSTLTIEQKVAAVQKFEMPDIDAMTLTSRSGKQYTLTHQSGNLYKADFGGGKVVEFNLQNGNPYFVSGDDTLLSDLGDMTSGGADGRSVLSSNKMYADAHDDSSHYHGYHSNPFAWYWLGHMAGSSNHHSGYSGGGRSGGTSVASGKASTGTGHSVSAGTRGGFGSVGGRSAIS